MRFYTEPFPQRSLCTEQFLHMFFYTNICLTQRNLYTQTAHRSFYRPRFLHAETLRRAVFTQQIFFAQKPLRTKTIIYTQQFLQTDRFYTQKVSESSPHRSLRHIFLRKTFFTYRRFYTQMSLHTRIAHRNLCTQHAFAHTANSYTERLCFPFLTPTYLSCSPAQVRFTRLSGIWEGSWRRVCPFWGNVSCLLVR